MNTAAPLQFLSDLLGAVRDRLDAPIPDWLDYEIRNKLVLLLNHLLQQNALARQRLAAQQGKVLHMQWQKLGLRLQITRAGLFNQAEDSRRPDLILHVEDTNALQLARQVMWRQHPQIHINGDVQLAALVSWLTDNVRWEAQADLARLIGAEPARHVSNVLQHMQRTLQKFVDATMPKNTEQRQDDTGEFYEETPATESHHWQ